MSGLTYLIVLFWAGILAWFGSSVISMQQERIEFDRYVEEHKCTTASDETIWKCEAPSPHWVLREKQ